MCLIETEIRLYMIIFILMILYICKYDGNRNKSCISLPGQLFTDCGFISYPKVDSVFDENVLINQKSCQTWYKELRLSC